MRRLRPVLLSCSALCLAALTACTGVQAGQQEQSASQSGYTFKDLTLMGKDNRAIPARVFRPQTDCSPCDLIIFSHGAFATYDRYDVLLTDWASKGFVVIAPQHVDSEEHPQRETYKGIDSQSLRLEDYFKASSMFGESDFSFDGLTFSGTQFATGHSFGGLIALLAGGAELKSGPVVAPDGVLAPKAVVAISPPGEIADRIDSVGYSKVNVPVLVVTGTTDKLPGFIDEWEIHLDSYEASPAGLGYGLVFEGMNHYFNGAYGRIKPEGLAAQPSVDTLNSQISAFLRAASAGTPPSGPDWEQSENPTVRILQK